MADPTNLYRSTDEAPVRETGHVVTRSVLPDGRSTYLVTDKMDQIVGDAIRRTGAWKPHETALIGALVSPGDHVVDVGAHVGHFTVLLSKLVGPTGRVVAFEPEPQNFELLKANCILNGCGNVVLESRALGNEWGVSKLYLAVGDLGDHRLYYVSDRPSTAVEVERFDDRLSGARLDFIKLDTRGSEAAILQGASKSLSTNADRLVCLMEICPRLSRACGYDLPSVLEILAELGAHLFSTTLPPCAMDSAALSELWHRLLAGGVEDASEMILLGFSESASDRIRARLAKHVFGADGSAAQAKGRAGVPSGSEATSGTTRRRQVFQHAYRHHLWGRDERSRFFSGVGSSGEAGDVYVRNMSDLLRRHVQELRRPVALVDLGCGDYRIGSALVARVPQLIYVGCDIVPELIDYNNAKFANDRVRFLLLDMVSDTLPEGDVCLVKQVFQHCSNADIKSVLRKLRYRHVYITEGQPEDRVGAINADQATSAGIRFDSCLGRGRGVELDMPPFNLAVREMFRASAPPHEIIVTLRVER